MANNYFRFKQFTINQENCAMKVGTDGCLLGAWARIDNCRTILDVGCGTGLIAIMAAQRNPEATITAIEIDAKAAGQAAENAKESPWNSRIEIINCDFLSHTSEQKYDTIISNPPYFVNSLTCPDSQRNTARHDDTLTSRALLEHAYTLLHSGGHLSIIIPTDLRDVWCNDAHSTGFGISRETYVHTRPDAPSKRVLIEFIKGDSEVTATTEHFTLETSPGCFTDEATALLKDFYLKLEAV